MPPRVHTFLFGRFNITYAVDEEKNAFIYRSLSAPNLVQIRSHKFGFFAVNNYERDGRLFICGQLVKYRNTVTETVDEGSHQVVAGEVPDNVIAKSDFCMDYRTGVIAYRPVGNRLSPYLFRYAFCELVLEANDRMFTVAAIETIPSDLSVIEAITNFTKVTEVSVELHPTNPSSRDPFARLDERIQELGASSYSESARNPDGLNKAALEGDNLRNGLYMALDGYGKGLVRGLINGVERVVTTGDSPQQTTISKPASQEELLEAIRPQIMRQLERMRQ